MNSAVDDIEKRPVSKQLRHRRRDLWWRAKLRFGKQYGPPTDCRTMPDADCPELAVGAVALGAKYRDWGLTMLRSLRGCGQFKGPVYIVTDDPRAFAGEDNVCTIAVPPVRPRLVAKSCKLLLAEWMPTREFLYIDTDLVVTGPVAPWYRAMQPLLDTAPVLCYPDRKPYDGAFHSGLILAETRRAVPVYRRWLRLLRSGQYEFDQQSLAIVAQQGDVLHMPGDDFTLLPDMLAVDEVIPRFVHITNGMIRKHSETELRNFLSQRLGVERMPESFGRGA